VAEVSILSGEMVSGQRLAQVPASAGTVRTWLGGDGEITCTIPLRDRWIWPRRLELISMLEPWRTFLAFQVGQTLVEAGPIVAHQMPDDDSGLLTVKAVGLRGLLRRRLAINATSATPQKETLSYLGLSLGTIGKRVVQRTLANPGGSLPVVLPPDEAGDHERTVPGHEFATVEQLLTDLSGVQGGPEFAFPPRFTADTLGVEWVMRAGTASVPQLGQTGDDWIWDYSAAGAVTNLAVQRDAGNRVNSAYVTGQGMDEAILTARATGADEWARGYPLLDEVYSHSTVGRQQTLDSWPPAYLQQGSRPWTSWKLSVQRDAYPTLREYRAGDWARVYVVNHPYLPDGTYRSRIGSFTASLGSSVVPLEMLPTLEWR